MHIMNMSKKKFESLKTLPLEDNIFNTEAKMYVFNEKNGWGGRWFVLKCLFNDIGTVFSNKLYTVNELIDRKNEIAIDELVMPEKLVCVDEKIVGFTLPLINSINFQTILDSPQVSNKEKVEYFKQIGIILEKIKNVRTYTSLNDFYLNNLHENNFVLNNDTGKINVVDMDSCKINGNIPFGSRYLSPMSKIGDVSKYKKVDKSICCEVFEISENTDYYCYMVMILNYLYGGKITNLSIDEYYDYLEYLRSIGVSSELINAFYLIYEEKNNINPYECLDSLSYIDGRTNYRVYEHVRKKNK